MNSATIKLFLTTGDAKSLRWAEISNWSGKAIAAPRTELDALLQRSEVSKSGVYILIGTDPSSGSPTAYIGEAEIIRDRLRTHRSREFWVSAIVFTSKDENLTKAHIKYLEGRLIEEAGHVGRFRLENSQASGAKLPEADRADMEVFLSHIRQLLPVLGTDLLVEVGQAAAKSRSGEILFCKMKGAEGRGHRTAEGFVVLKGSSAVLEERKSANKWPTVTAQRNKLISEGTLVRANGFYEFKKDVEFSSPSAAAAVIEGGSANGLIEWKTKTGQTLKGIDEQS